jgi:hypothetical protein
VTGSIAWTRTLHLDEALRHLRSPPVPKATFPLRPTEEEAGRSTLAIVTPPADPQPGPSHRPSIPGTSGGGISALGAHHAEESSKPSANRTSGKFRPEDSEDIRKYGTKNLPQIIKRFLESALESSKNARWENPSKNDFLKLVSESLSQGTWKRYGAALNAWKKFMHRQGLNWRKLKKCYQARFICWCNRERNLKAVTVKAYLSALTCLRKIWGEIQRGGGKNWKTFC